MPTSAFTNFYEVGLKEVDAVIAFYDENQTNKNWSEQRLWLDIGIRILVGGFRYYLYYLPQDIMKEISKTSLPPNDINKIDLNRYCESGLPIFGLTNKNNITTLFMSLFEIDLANEISKQITEQDILIKIDELMEKMVRNRRNNSSECWAIKKIDDLKYWRKSMLNICRIIDTLTIEAIRNKFEITNRRITKRLTKKESL